MDSPRLRKSNSPVHPSNREVVDRGVRGVVITGRPPSLILWSAFFFFLGFLAVLVVGLWVRQQTGSLNWADVDQPAKMFSYHPFFMTLGLLYIHGFANLTYRLFPGGNYTALRVVHGLLQATAFVLGCLGIYAAHFYKEHTFFRRRFFHYKSVHSWLGMLTITLVGLQWVCGFFGLLFPGLHGRWFQKYRIVHKYVGKATFFLICGTVLVGIDQLSKGSTSLNIAAYIVILYGMLGAYLLFESSFATAAPEVIPVIAGRRNNETVPMLSTAEVDDM